MLVSIDVATYMTSTERVLEYAEVDQEQPLYQAPSAVAATPTGDADKLESKSPPSLTYAQYIASASASAGAGASSGANSGANSGASESQVKGDVDFGIELSAMSTAKAAASSSAARGPARLWPRRGVVEFRSVWMQYRDNPPVLKGVSFKSNPGERIGVSHSLSQSILSTVDHRLRGQVRKVEVDAYGLGGQGLDG